MPSLLLSCVILERFTGHGTGMLHMFVSLQAQIACRLLHKPNKKGFFLIVQAFLLSYCAGAGIQVFASAVVKLVLQNQDRFRCTGIKVNCSCDERQTVVLPSACPALPSSLLYNVFFCFPG